MADDFPVHRVRLPPSTITGDLRLYLTEIAAALNMMPRISYTSYGNPNSNVTGQRGDLLVNLVTSTNTALWWGKQYWSNNTGWVSLVTA